MKQLPIKELIDEMQRVKDQDQKDFNKIQWKKTRRTRDIIEREKQEKLENKELDLGLPQITNKNEIYAAMKNRFRMAWKSPGLVNKEFNQVPTLRGKILNEWEIERINLAERSYKAPLGYQGMKIPSQYKEFSRPLTPQGFKQHLDDFRTKFDDYVQRPSQYGPVHEDKLLEKTIKNNKEPFRLVNTVQYMNFGFDPHQTWEAELLKKASNSIK